MRFEEHEFDKEKGITEIFQYDDDDGLIIGSMFIHRRKKKNKK